MAAQPEDRPPESGTSSRKNSILVTDPLAEGRTASAHPHFVDNLLPLRSSGINSISASSTSLATAGTPSGSQQNLHYTSHAPYHPLSSPGGPGSGSVSPGAHGFVPTIQTATQPSSYSLARAMSPVTTDSEIDPRDGSQPIVGRSTSKQPSDPRIPKNDGKIHILIGATGSLHISSVRQMVSKLQTIYGNRAAIQVVLTTAADKILQRTDMPSNVQVWHDNDEWETWHGRNDPVIHIELRRWADILVVAPLSANTLGKIAMGLCDNLLTNIVRAWNSQFPILIAPAMVSYAYNHPATRSHMRTIRDEMKWIEILRPTEKVAGSTGGIGMGGMMAWNEIVDRVVQKLGGYPEDDDDDEEDDDDDSRSRPSGNEEDDEDEDEDEDESGTKDVVAGNVNGIVGSHTSIEGSSRLADAVEDT